MDFYKKYAGKTLSDIIDHPDGSAIGIDYLPCEPGKP